MPTAASRSATPPNPSDSSIGVRRECSDRSMRSGMRRHVGEQQPRGRAARAPAAPSRRPASDRRLVLIDEARRRRSATARTGIVGAQPRVLALDELAMLHRADDADDFEPPGVGPRLDEIVGLRRLEHAPADRIALRPELLRQALVDDDHAWRLRVIAVPEKASAPERNVQRLEVARRHVAVPRRDDRFARRHRVAFRDR